MKSSEVLPWVALVAFFFVMQLEIRLEVHSLRLKLTELSSYTHNQDQSQSTQASAYWAAAHRQELLLDDSKNAEEASARPTSGTGTLSEKETMEEGTGSRAKDPPFEVSVGSAPLQVDAAYSATVRYTALLTARMVTPVYTRCTSQFTLLLACRVNSVWRWPERQKYSRLIDRTRHLDAVV